LTHEVVYPILLPDKKITLVKGRGGDGGGASERRRGHGLLPVIAVPTSIGYGASFGGLAALLAMLNSCAAGVAVMNIDNGFGAGYFAHLVNR